jgi:hypothetical protein
MCWDAARVLIVGVCNLNIPPLPLFVIIEFKVKQ